MRNVLCCQGIKSFDVEDFSDQKELGLRAAVFFGGVKHFPSNYQLAKQYWQDQIREEQALWGSYHFITVAVAQVSQLISAGFHKW